MILNVINNWLAGWVLSLAADRVKDRNPSLGKAGGPTAYSRPLCTRRGTGRPKSRGHANMGGM